MTISYHRPGETPGEEAEHLIEIDGHSLSLAAFIEVARFHQKVSLSKEALFAMEKSRQLAEKIALEKRVAYGITTGFGDFATVAVPEEKSNELSTNLIMSHSTATGEPYTKEQVRGMMLLRANALAVGVSGVRPRIAKMLLEMLNRNVVPYVPQKGSLGASGDLAPLSHIGLVLLGKGRAYFEGELLSGEEAMQRAGIATLETLVSKEGLGITNGTCAMTSVGALVLYDALELAKAADLISSLTFTALTGQLSAFDPRIHDARGQKGQRLVAGNMRRLLSKSPLVEKSQGLRVQDAYSLRCIPQVHGAVRDALSYIEEKVMIELNAVTDNPLLFPEDEAVISGGNFHGEPMALPFDFLGIALSELGSIAERRTERLVNAQLSNGLPPFLVKEGGLNSGFMIVQYSSASMASENKVLAHPASVDSIPSSANQEDFVSMGTTAARKALWILENSRSILAYELLTALQALDFRLEKEEKGAEEMLSPIQLCVYQAVRERVSFMERDREIWKDIEEVEILLRNGTLGNILKEQMPEVE